jgi:hypothetical protein
MPQPTLMPSMYRSAEGRCRCAGGYGALSGTPKCLRATHTHTHTHTPQVNCAPPQSKACSRARKGSNSKHAWGLAVACSILLRSGHACALNMFIALLVSSPRVCTLAYRPLYAVCTGVSTPSWVLRMKEFSYKGRNEFVRSCTSVPLKTPRCRTGKSVWEGWPGGRREGGRIKI